MSGQVAASWLATTISYKHDKNQLDSLRDCQKPQSLHRKISVQILRSQCIIIPVEKIAGNLIWMKPQLDPTSSIRQIQNDPVTQEPLQSLKTNSSIQYLFSVTYNRYLTTKHTDQRPERCQSKLCVQITGQCNTQDNFKNPVHKILGCILSNLEGLQGPILAKGDIFARFSIRCRLIL